jgi:hypothetical protein
VLGQRVQGDVSFMFRALFIGEFLGKKLNVLTTVEPVYNGNPWDSKSGRCSLVVVI